MLKERRINFQKIVAITGMPGLYHLKSYNNKGFFVESYINGFTRFISNAKDRVLALGNIDIAIKDGSISLLELFQRMDQYPGRVPDEHGHDEVELSNYFEQVIPNYDREKLFPGNMRKIVQWYTFIKELVLARFEEAINEADEKLPVV